MRTISVLWCTVLCILGFSQPRMELARTTEKETPLAISGQGQLDDEPEKSVRRLQLSLGLGLAQYRYAWSSLHNNIIQSEDQPNIGYSTINLDILLTYQLKKQLGIYINSPVHCFTSREAPSIINRRFALGAGFTIVRNRYSYYCGGVIAPFFEQIAYQRDNATYAGDTFAPLSLETLLNRTAQNPALVLGCSINFL